MKNLLALSLVALILATPALATQSPFSPALNKRLNQIEAGTTLDTGSVTSAKILDGTIVEADFASQAVDGLHPARVARFEYACATDTCTVGAHTLGVFLPAKAVIIRSYFQVIAQFTDTGTCTIALSCEDANNIKTATDISGSSAGAFVDGASTGAASAFVGSIAAACEITATVADGGSCAISAGKLIGFVHYVVTE